MDHVLKSFARVGLVAVTAVAHTLALRGPTGTTLSTTRVTITK